jgi:Uncharacterized conserved protein (DUF2190)
MSQFLDILSVSRRAAASVARRRFVDYNGVQVAAIATVSLGVAQVDAAIGEDYEVVVQGIARVEAAGVIAVGGSVEAAADGRAQAFTTGSKCGRALTAAAAAGEIIEVLMLPSA